MLAKNYEERPTAGEVLGELRSLERATNEGDAAVPTMISDDLRTPVTAQLRVPRHG